VSLDRQRARADQGADVPTIACDVRAEDQVVAALDEAAELLGAPANVLVNAAGVYRVSPLLEITRTEWEEVLDTNVAGSFFVARAFVRALIAAGEGGSIVNLSSVAALVADRSEPSGHYTASKGAILALSRQMAVEWAEHGIRVNAICPGVIDTPMLRLTDDPDATARYLDNWVPLRRIGCPEEVAAAAAFLASPDSSYLTGTALPVDGGTTAI
jgi:NAD(P)-dependent dehydrogenase (short-subunit alcohol dehydrogenase family)